MKLLKFNFFDKKPKEEIPSRLFKQWIASIPQMPNNDLQHLIFGGYSMLNYVIKRSRISKRQRFEKFRDAYYRSDIRRQTFPKQEVINMGSVLGYGVIAKESISSNTYLGEYTGIVRKPISSLDKSNRYLVRYPVKCGFLNYLVIDAKRHGNHTRFYNHSNKPNAQLISVISDGIFRMIVASTKRIQNESQILLDYGKLYWNQIAQTPNDFL